MIAITQGDPAGIGPEITLKGFSPRPRRLHIGLPDVYRETARWLGLPLTMQVVSTPEEALSLPPDQFVILPPPLLKHGTFSPSSTNAPTEDDKIHDAARATVQSIRYSCQLALERRVDGIVTPPIHKASLHAAGYRFPGHTEMFAYYTGVQHPVMMLATPGLRVVPATIHMALSEVPHTLTESLLEQIVLTTHTALKKDFGLENPRITVTGLNPHAGEEGAFGREEQEMILPLCHRLNRVLDGAIRGPLPADSLFHPEARKHYDAVICMYHDQALIPLKMLGFGRAVNLTLGLPIVRTSVDHGTAYNIAKRGIADPSSFIEAVRMAESILQHRALVQERPPPTLHTP